MKRKGCGLETTPEMLEGSKRSAACTMPAHSGTVMPIKGLRRFTKRPLDTSERYLAT